MRGLPIWRCRPRPATSNSSCVCVSVMPKSLGASFIGPMSLAWDRDSPATSWRAGPGQAGRGSRPETRKSVALDCGRPPGAHDHANIALNCKIANSREDAGSDLVSARYQQHPRRSLYIRGERHSGLNHTKGNLAHIALRKAAPHRRKRRENLGIIPARTASHRVERRACVESLRFEAVKVYDDL